MSKHSPGPWGREIRGEYDHIVDANGNDVISGGADGDNGWIRGGCDMIQDDARLIAAARVQIDMAGSTPAR